MASSSQIVLFPPLKWADRHEYIFLTVALQDTKDVSVRIENNGAVLHFSCSATPPRNHQNDSTGCIQYSCDLELYMPISPEESQHVVRARQVELKLKKKCGEGDEERWPRLTKEKKKNLPIEVDWVHWQETDEDEADEEDMKKFTDFGMSDEELVSHLRSSNEKDVAKDIHADPSSWPSFGSAAGQQPISDEEIMNAVDEDDDVMPPLEEI